MRVREWQREYVGNMVEGAALTPLLTAEGDAGARVNAAARLRELKARNTALLSEQLFPALDALGSAGEGDIAELTEFGDALMDWKNNLDCGVYVAIHGALLRLYRLRHDRAGTIRELYKLGMGLYYLHRPLVGVECRESESMHFQNEMVFSEAAAYFRYFAAIDDSDTRAYILRAMANVSICATNFRRRINTCVRFIQVVKSPAYRALAPELPWDTYLQRVHQQLSSCRSGLQGGDITREEVAAVMDSCYEVFKPEEQSANPSVRWLWPYYDMEYNCGYVSPELTARRLEKLIHDTPKNQFDVSGLYGGIQLPIYLGRLLRDNEKLRAQPERIEALDAAYRRMLDTLMAVPPEVWDENFFYTLKAVVTDFYEVDGLMTYRELTSKLMRRFGGALQLRAQLTGALLERACVSALRRDPRYFRELPQLRGLEGDAREAALARFARECGEYMDFGLFKMNMERVRMQRELFDNEYEMYRLHTVSGCNDLSARASTAALADVARGHHSAYNGGGDDPSGYNRIESPCRRLTDIAAIIAALLDSGAPDAAGWAELLRAAPAGRFSPRAVALMLDGDILEELYTMTAAAL